jgi:hypothetical protein
VAQQGEAGDGSGDRWSSAVPEWPVKEYASVRSSWRQRWGQSVAGGGGACGGARSGLSGGDLAVKARARGQWRQLRVSEAAVDQRAFLGGGGWTRHSPEWADDGEAPATEEADAVDCFNAWWPVAPALAMGLTEVQRRRPGARQQLVAGGTACQQWQQQAKHEHAME